MSNASPHLRVEKRSAVILTNAANFLEEQNDFGKIIQKQWQKNEGQKHGDCVSSKNAHNEATISRKYFSVLHFSVMTFLKS
jgi:hypothetical protein